MRLHIPRLPERSARRASLIGGLAYAFGLAAGLIGAWFLPTWVLAALLTFAFALWIVTRRPL